MINSRLDNLLYKPIQKRWLLLETFYSTVVKEQQKAGYFACEVKQGGIVFGVLPMTLHQLWESGGWAALGSILHRSLQPTTSAWSEYSSMK